MQEVKKALLESFANDIFVVGMQSIQNCHDKMKRAFVQFHYHCENIKQIKAWQSMSPIHDTYERLHCISKGLLALLHASPEEYGLGVKNALPLLEYKGSEAFESSIASAIEQNKYWRRLVDSSNKAAGSSKEQFPILSTCLAKAKDAVNGGVRPEVYLNTLAEILPLLDGMRMGLKPAATQELEIKMMTMLPSTCKYILAAKTCDGIDTEKVSNLIDHLDLFDAKSLEAVELGEHAADVADMRLALQQWQTKMSSSIASQKLERFIDGCLSQVTPDMQEETVIKIDWLEFAKLLLSSADPPEHVQSKMSESIFLMIRELDMQAILYSHKWDPIKYVLGLGLGNCYLLLVYWVLCLFIPVGSSTIT